MPRIQLPLPWRVRHPEPRGPVRMHLRAEVWIEIEYVPNVFEPFRVLIDTGASYSVMSAEWAGSLGLSVPPVTSRMRFTTAAGPQTVRVSDAEVRVRFPQLPDHPFPILWLLQHDLPPGVPPVLGLHNVIDFVRITVDGTYHPQAPMGHMSLEVMPSP